MPRIRLSLLAALIAGLMVSPTRTAHGQASAAAPATGIAASHAAGTPAVAAGATVLLAPGAHRVVVAPAETLNVEVRGQGQPVVMIPGILGNAASFRRAAALMAQSNWQAIIIDPLGVGHSSGPAPADYSLIAQADRVAMAMRQLGVERAVVIGHLAGGSVGFRLAWRHPELVASLVTLEGGPTESVVTPGFRRAMKIAPLVVKLGGAGMIRGRIRDELKAGSADPAWVTDERLEAYLAPAGRDLQAALRVFRAMGESTEPEPLAPHLVDVRCPVQVLLGGAPHDGGIRPEELAALRRAIPSLVSLSVPDCGLYVQEEQPAAVVTAVRRAARMSSVSLAANATSGAGSVPSHPIAVTPAAAAGVAPR